MIALHNTPVKALQLEAELVTQLCDQASNHIMAFWTTDQCLVVPASMKNQAGYTKACTQMSHSEWPVLLRKTGGGVTPQGPGILNIALAYALDPVEKPTISGVYHMFCAPLIKLLDQSGCSANTGFVPNSFCNGEYNVVVAGKKVMGTAQRWTRMKSKPARQIIFAHALILFDADLHAGVNAVNRLYRACGIDKCIEVDAHANLQALASARGNSVNQSQVVQILSGLYLHELAALTE